MADLLQKVKSNLILSTDKDDDVIKEFIGASISYAESYPKKPAGYYSENLMPPTTERPVIMLPSHFYESRGGSTGGFFSDNVNAANQVWSTVNPLLRIDKDWRV